MTSPNHIWVSSTLVRLVEPSATRCAQAPPAAAGHQVDRKDRPVAADGQVGQQNQLVGVAQVLDKADGPEVDLARDQHVVQLVRGVLDQLDVGQRAGADQAPVERQAVEELDVTDAGSPPALGEVRFETARRRSIVRPTQATSA